MSTKRFLVMDDDEIASKSKQAKNSNTDKSERRADKAFRKFLEALGYDENDTDYWYFDEPTLDGCLAKFWFGARKDIWGEEDESNDPDMKNRLYSANSLKNFRYGLNRILKNKGHLYDIIEKKTASFTRSRQAFADALKELKSEGKGEVHSYPEIDEEGQ